MISIKEMIDAVLVLSEKYCHIKCMRKFLLSLIAIIALLVSPVLANSEILCADEQCHSLEQSPKDTDTKHAEMGHHCCMHSQVADRRTDKIETSAPFNISSHPFAAYRDLPASFLQNPLLQPPAFV